MRRRVGVLAARCADSVYRAALRIRYPEAVWRRFGDDMVADARRLIRESAEDAGARGVVRALARLTVDLARPLPAPRVGAPREDTVEHVRTERRGGMGRLWRGTWDDIGFAARSLAREPRFVALIGGVLAVGMALHVLAFSVVNAYLLRPLPFPDSERLVTVDTWGAVGWTEVSEVFDLAVSWDLDVFTIVDGERPEVVPGAWVTPDFLEAYGVRPALGRNLDQSEAGPSAGSVAMISHDLWTRRFGADPDVLGRSFEAYMADRPEETELFTIVGVLPEDFWYLNEYTDVLVPIREERTMYTGRMRPGVEVEQARAFLEALSSGRLRDAPPGFRVTVRRLHEQYVEAVRPTVLVLQVAVLLVLVIACANAGVLLLVRATRREREMGVRRALGAGRVRLVRQLLAEGLMVTATGGVLGTAMALAVLGSAREVVVTRLGRSAPGGLDALTVDGSVLGATLLVVLVIGIAFGLVPLAVGGRSGLARGLRASGSVGGGRARRRARDVMVVSELALSLALLSGAALMVRSALYLQSRDLGFDPERVVRGELGLREASHPEAADRHRFFDALIDGVRALPAVEAASVVSSTPFSGRREPADVETEETGVRAQAVFTVVGDGYFDVMGIPVLDGRDFSPSDAYGTEPVAVVSARLAEQLWPGMDPVGRSLRGVARVWMDDPPEPGPFHRVIGVVADVERGVASADVGGVYQIYRQAAPRFLTLVAKAREGAGPVVPEVEDVLGRLDAEVPLSDVAYIADQVDEARAPTRFLAWVLSGFAAFSFLLAVVGLYGVICYAVRERRRDVAIRMALGADSHQVTGIFVAGGMAVAAAGVGLGVLGGLALGRGLAGQLHGVRPGDPLTMLGLSAALLLTALAAVWMPARSASRADPMAVLREE